MKPPRLLPAVAAAMLSVTTAHAADHLKVLIIDRQNNHDWKMTIDYGKGRVFHDVLGHRPASMVDVGFQVTFARGTEWAATGRVTLPVPKAGDFATDKVAERKPTAVPR